MSSVESVARPAPVRVAFVLYLCAAGLSMLNAVVQVVSGISGGTVLLGAIIEATLFMVVGVSMRAGKRWARLALLGVSGVLIGFGALVIVGLSGMLGGPEGGLAQVTLGFVVVKLALLVAATVMMFRPRCHGYFR